MSETKRVRTSTCEKQANTDRAFVAMHLSNGAAVTVHIVAYAQQIIYRRLDLSHAVDVIFGLRRMYKRRAHLLFFHMSHGKMPSLGMWLELELFYELRVGLRIEIQALVTVMRGHRDTEAKNGPFGKQWKRNLTFQNLAWNESKNGI